MARLKPWTVSIARALPVVLLVLAAFRTQRRFTFDARLSGIFADVPLNTTFKTYLTKHARLRAPPAGKSQAPTYDLEVLRHVDEAEHAALTVCRVRNACIRNGQVVIDEKLKEHVDTLRKCGMEEVTYFNSSLRYNDSNVDLLGAKPLRDHMPHFVTDLLSAMRAAEMVEPSLRMRQKIERECFGKCARGRMNWKVSGHYRIGRRDVSAWTSMVGRMLLPDMAWEFEQEGCYRSIVGFDDYAHAKMGKWWTGENLRFAKAGLERKRRKTCRVVILNRDGLAKRNDMIVGRDIVNAGKLEKMITRRFQKVQDVRIVYFENRSAEDQARVMQSADIIIGAHGAGLANLIFARQHSRLIEVVPFGYGTGFGGLARAMGVDYEMMYALPDEKHVQICLDKMEDRELAKEVQEMWERGLQEGYTSLNGHERQEARICGRGQRMKVDTSDILKRMRKAVSQVC